MDFVATRQNEKIYVQVTQRIDSEKTEKREYDRLLEIRDNYPKYVLRTDEFAGGNYEGIITMHVADFLLSSAYWFGFLKRNSINKRYWYYFDTGICDIIWDDNYGERKNRLHRLNTKQIYLVKMQTCRVGISFVSRCAAIHR